MNTLLGREMKQLVKNIIKGNNPYTLLGFNIVLFAIIASSPWTVSFSIPWVMLTLALYFCLICLGVSITYHRALTHKALTLHPWVERLFVTFACYAGTGSPIMWVMTHRQHHRFSDREGDPHPPESVWKTFFGAYPRVSARGIRDIARVKYYAWWHRYYFGILLAAAAVLALISFNLFFFAFALPIFMSITASNLLNWYGHTKSMISYRNYDLKDRSQNNPFFGWVIFGEGWHNNHHRHPGSAKFGLDKYEFDPSFAVIRLLRSVGLASNVREATL